MRIDHMLRVVEQEVPCATTCNRLKLLVRCIDDLFSENGWENTVENMVQMEPELVAVMKTKIDADEKIMSDDICTLFLRAKELLDSTPHSTSLSSADAETDTDHKSLDVTSHTDGSHVTETLSPSSSSSSSSSTSSSSYTPSSVMSTNTSDEDDEQSSSFRESIQRGEDAYDDPDDASFRRVNVYSYFMLTLFVIILIMAIALKAYKSLASFCVCPPHQVAEERNRTPFIIW